MPDDAGHVAQGERPDVVARAVVVLLDEVPAGPPPPALTPGGRWQSSPPEQAEEDRVDDDQQGAAAGTGPEVTGSGDTAPVADEPVPADESAVDQAPADEDGERHPTEGSSPSSQSTAPPGHGPSVGAPIEPGAGPLDLSPEVARLAEPVSPTAGSDHPSVRASTPDRPDGESA